jgi:Fic family protein
LLLDYNPYEISSLLEAHKILMFELSNEVGMFRTGGVGVFAGSQLVHMAPPAKFVPTQVNQLLEW